MGGKSPPSRVKSSEQLWAEASPLLQYTQHECGLNRKPMSNFLVMHSCRVRAKGWRTLIFQFSRFG